MIPASFIGAAVPLAPGDVVAEAALLQCTTAIVHAFSDIESAGSGYVSEADRRPKILFEARYFHLLTQGAYDRVAPSISSPVWDRSLYGAGGAHQYDRLTLAMSFDRTAALKSASIGRFQIMGANYHAAGFDDVESMWAAFCDSEDAHLVAFGAFVTSIGLVPALRADPPRFVDLAVGYNGAGERANGYDQKIEVAYRHYAAQGEGIVPSATGIPSVADNPATPPLPPVGSGFRTLRLGMSGPDVLTLQHMLNAHAVDPGDPAIDADGAYGPQTFDAVELYQRDHPPLAVDGVAGPLTQHELGIV